MTRRRYTVERCDNCGSVTDADGNDVPVEWHVIDRVTDRVHPIWISTHRTRAQARAEAAELNATEAALHLAAEARR